MFRGVLGSWLADSRWLLMENGKFRMIVEMPGHYTSPLMQLNSVYTKDKELVITGHMKQNDGRMLNGWFGPEQHSKILRLQ